MTDSDQHHLVAAHGWLELGLVNEAMCELDRIEPQSRANPLVIMTRWEACRAAKQWTEAVEIARGLLAMAPDDFDGRWRLSFSLHETKQTQEAYDNLASVADKFAGEFITHYNLACYLTRLGRLDEARARLKRAFALNPNKRAAALGDKDLEPLWPEIQGR